MRRRIFALLLGATLALGALSGCGNTATTDDTTVDPAASPALEESPMASPEESAAPSS